jgi:hypothetical protein
MRYLLFFLLSHIVSAQNVPAIKIYLEDAVTGKNVCDAKVTLEGFEIPAITGKYDKKGKYYYFKEIPKGYNTIMSYHKKYNEKGFQNIEGLPSVLTLNLFTPLRIRLVNDSLNFYKEDATKLVVVMNDTLYNSQAKCELEKNDYLCFAKKYFEDHFPELDVYNQIGGLFSLDNFSFYVMRKDKKKFKRFNDPIIKKIGDDKNILFVLGMLLETKVVKSENGFKKEYFKEDGTPNYKPQYVKYINYDTINRTVFKNKPYSFRYINQDYRDKYFKGLLVNDTYKFSDAEIKSFYSSDKKKINNGELYDFDPLESKDTIVRNMKFLNNMPLYSLASLPYKLISNIPKFQVFRLDFKNGKLNQSIDYSYQISLYIKNKNLINESQKGEIKLYEFKTKYASPFGVSDMIMFYKQYQGINIRQNIESLKK